MHPGYRVIYEDNERFNCATALVGGFVELVHVAGNTFARCNEYGLLQNLPPNACGFVGDFFIFNRNAEGEWVSVPEDDQRRAMKWIAMSQCVRPPPTPTPPSWR
jgi:hypothetical protein